MKYKPKETFWSIEQKYGISDEDLKAANPGFRKRWGSNWTEIGNSAKGLASKAVAKCKISS